MDETNGAISSPLDGLDTGRFLDGPEFQVYHDHGNQANIFDRIDLKPSQNDTISVNFQFTRSWFQTPNSFDSQTADAWSGLVVDNGGLGPNGVPVGPTDQRSKIRTFDIAPTWTHLVNPNTVFTLGAFVRQDQYNYYPSNNPVRRFDPGSSNRHSWPESPFDQFGRTRQRLVPEGHPQHQGWNHL